jgi:hypothetical protein
VTGSRSKTITLRHGKVVSLSVMLRLWAIEARGGRFNVSAGGGLQVTPRGSVTPTDCAFLREHRDEARRLVEYQPDDSCLTGHTAPETFASVSS